MRYAVLLSCFVLVSCKTSQHQAYNHALSALDSTDGLLSNANGNHAHLAGVGHLTGSMACTGWLFQPGLPEHHPALVVASGHCATGAFDHAASAILIDQVPSRPSDVTFNYFHDTTRSQIKHAVKTVRYATMRTVDVAIFELDATYADLAAQGIRPLRIAAQAPAQGSAVQVVGTPEGNYLTAEDCTDMGAVSLIEFNWAWPDSRKNSCSQIRDQSSGSPVFDSSGAVYAAINTTSVGGAGDTCYLEGPCEVTKSGASLVPNSSYGVDVTKLKNCFDSDSKLAFGVACPLPPPDGLSYDSAPTNMLVAAASDSRDLAWNATITAEPKQKVRVKYGAATTTDCRSPIGYGAPVDPSEALTGSTLPGHEGHYVACVLADNGSEPADPRFPLVIIRSVDNTPPTMRPPLHFAPPGIGRGLGIDPIFVMPELVDYEYAYGKNLDCEKAKYARYLRVTIHIPRDALPTTLCLRGTDFTGHKGPAFSYDVDEKNH